MTNEEFLKDVCPNHTEKSKWNRNELLHILELHEKQLCIGGVTEQDLHEKSNLHQLLIEIIRDFKSKNFSEVISYKASAFEEEIGGQLVQFQIIATTEIEDFLEDFETERLIK